MIKVAIIGTVGVPANYGGFETLVENIIKCNNSEELQYSVYCSSKNYKEKYWVYKGAKIIYLPFRANGLQSILYDAVSIIHALFKADTLLILGVSGCIILPVIHLFSRKKILVNIDGLEHRRNKWKKYIRKFLKFSEKMAVKYADTIITDNKGIQNYVLTEYGKESVLIEYGGDHVLCKVDEVEGKTLEKYKLYKDSYSIALCRIEPENNVELILQSFQQTNEPLVFVGNWQNSEFGKSMYNQYFNVAKITLLEPIYDVESLNILRSNCKYYIHGHSAGGTNPSLVEAMFFGCPVFAFDVVYNRETTENKADYFKNTDELNRLVNSPLPLYEENRKMMKEIAYRRYKWSKIVDAYEHLYIKSGNGSY